MPCGTASREPVHRWCHRCTTTPCRPVAARVRGGLEQSREDIRAPHLNGFRELLRLKRLLEVPGMPRPMRLPHVLATPLEEPVRLQRFVHMPGKIERHAPLPVLDVAEIG